MEMIEIATGGFEVECKKHRTYKGIRLPKTGCPGCWIVWVMCSGDLKTAKKYVTVHDLREWEGANRIERELS